MATDYRNALPTGTKIEEFVLKEVIGDGGFGITYLAHDEHLQISVAIKEYMPVELAVRTGDFSVHPRSGRETDNYQWGLKRFLDEARILAKFDHPSIVRVRRFLQANNTAYIAMRYEEGETLGQMLKRRGVLKETELRKFLSPLLEGLELVHSAGVLHRDIKPANIRVHSDGSPVLVDFGAARQAVGERSKSITAVLTPPYAPWEQYGKTQRQGPWTDIYALGAVCYEALTGQQIPEAPDRQVAETLRPLAEAARVECSPAMRSGIHAALAVHAAQRPQSIQAWRGVLEEEEKQKKNWFPAVVLTAVFVIVVVVIASQDLQPPPPPPPKGDDSISTPKPKPEPRLTPAKIEASLNLDLDDRIAVQEALTALSFGTEGVDGVFGPKTRNAITMYQQKHGLASTGYLDDRLVQRIKKEGQIAIASQGVVIEVCNRSSLDSDLALGYKEDGIWKSRGWFRVAVGSCTSPSVGTALRGDIYAYAQAYSDGEQKIWVPDTADQKAKFCVDIRDEFTLADAKCKKPDHPDYRWTTFGIVYRGNSGKFTWNLGTPVASVPVEAPVVAKPTPAPVAEGVVIEVCNKSSQTPYVALGYKTGATWSAKGWWKIAPGQCVVPRIETKLTGHIYAYATTSRSGMPGTTWTPDRDRAKFCVDIRDPFTLADDKCKKPDHADYQWAIFGIIYEGSSGKYTWTLGN